MESLSLPQGARQMIVDRHPSCLCELSGLRENKSMVAAVRSDERENGKEGAEKGAPMLYLAVHHFPELFSRFKEGDLLGRHRHRLAGLGVSSFLGAALADAEASAAADLHPIIPGQGVFDAVE